MFNRRLITYDELTKNRLTGIIVVRHIPPVINTGACVKMA